VVTGQVDLATALADGTVTIDGDPDAMANLVGLLAPVDASFNIVLP
jgi:alkyl sulfatase BDS1-like metallo-beta-lactamase superfamily hydrolase